eukprot:4080643-Amphidinium_carterae.1
MHYAAGKWCQRAWHPHIEEGLSIALVVGTCAPNAKCDAVILTSGQLVAPVGLTDARSRLVVTLSCNLKFLNPQNPPNPQK